MSMFWSGVPFLGVQYRLAPEVTGRTLAEDVFAGLAWLLGKAAAVGVDPARIAVSGDSGGGAPAAGTAILARDHRMALARQILVYPCSTTGTSGPAREPYLTWTYDDNFTAWSAVLGEDFGTGNVSPVTAPGREFPSNCTSTLGLRTAGNASRRIPAPPSAPWLIAPGLSPRSSARPGPGPVMSPLVQRYITSI